MKKGKKVIVLREPGSTSLGENIRSIILNQNEYGDMEIETEYLLFSVARAEMMRKKVIPLLKEGYFIIMDRFFDSSRVYQGIIGGIDCRDIENINRFVTNGILPDITFLLDLDVVVVVIHI